MKPRTVKSSAAQEAMTFAVPKKLEADVDLRGALRTTVETRGQTAPKAMYEAYDRFNRDYFAGELGAPVIFVTATSSPRALADYCGQDIHGIESRIRMSPRAFQHGLEFACDVLLHEMVHAWCEERAKQPEHGYRGHGPVFASKCNDIGERIGLPKVAARPRGKSARAAGVADCAQWPINVRPEDYYPEGARRRKPAQAEEAEDVDGAADDDEKPEPERPHPPVLDQLAGAIADTLRARVLELEGQLDVFRTRVGELEADVSELEAEIVAEEDRRERAVERAEQVYEDLEQFRKDAAAVSEALAQERAQRSALEQLVERREGELRELRSRIVDADAPPATSKSTRRLSQAMADSVNPAKRRR